LCPVSIQRLDQQRSVALEQQMAGRRDGSGIQRVCDRHCGLVVEAAQLHRRLRPASHEDEPLSVRQE
jgi:hypothetical protein